MNFFDCFHIVVEGAISSGLEDSSYFEDLLVCERDDVNAVPEDLAVKFFPCLNI